MFQIGEFSKITQVPGSQLRYYDEIGLFTPEKVDKISGYRFYSSQQIPNLNRILALKDLGLSLDQIQKMVQKDISPEEIRGMLSLKKMQVEQTVMDEVSRLRRIDARLRHIEAGYGGDDFEVIVKSIPEVNYLSNRHICQNFSEARKTLMDMFQVLPSRIDMKKLGPITGLLHNDMYALGDVDIELGVILKQAEDLVVSLPGGHQMNVRMLPAVETMVTSVRVGFPDESFNCREVIAGWIESNEYEITGTGREVFLVPPQPGKESETVTEIQYPVQLRQ